MVFRTFRQARISSAVSSAGAEWTGKRPEDGSGELIAPILQGAEARPGTGVGPVPDPPGYAVVECLPWLSVPAAAACTLVALSTDSRASGQCSVAARTESGTRWRLAAESARSASLGSGT